MENKRVASICIDGVELAVSVFVGIENAADGECVVRLSERRSNIHFYCRPSDLRRIAKIFDDCAEIVERVEKSGELPK